MMRWLGSPAALLALALLIGAAVVVGLGIGTEDGKNEADSATPVAREKGRKVGMRPAARGRERTKSGRELSGLSAEQVRSRLPAGDKPGLLRLTGRGMPEESALLFRRLGRLEGEAAIDEIVARYSNSGSYAAAAAVQAIVGWMEVDRGAAIAAFRELIAPQASAGNGIARQLFCWKGTGFVSGFG